MKIAEIKTDGTAYLAKVKYGSLEAKVTVLEKGIDVMGDGMKAVSQKRSQNRVGVRVRVEREVGDPASLYHAAEGEETTVLGREILREWTDEDEAGWVARKEARARAEALKAELGDLGFGVGHGSDVQVTEQSVTFTHEAFEKFRAR